MAKGRNNGRKRMEIFLIAKSMSISAWSREGNCHYINLARVIACRFWTWGKSINALDTGNSFNASDTGNSFNALLPGIYCCMSVLALHQVDLIVCPPAPSSSAVAPGCLRCMVSMAASSRPPPAEEAALIRSWALPRRTSPTPPSPTLRVGLPNQLHTVQIAT